jgi:hypothetical protein
MMYFKLKHVLNKFTFGFKGQEPLSFAFGDNQNTTISFRLLTADEKEKYKRDALLCTAITQEEPSDDVRALFDRLENNLMPEGFKKPKKKNLQATKNEYEYIDNEGRIKENHIPPVNLFPQYFQDFESQIHHKLSECIKRATKIIRWRNAIKSSHNPVLFTLGVSWSFDNQHWRGMPHDVYVVIGGEIEFYWPVSDELHSQMENLIKAEVEEPLGHELFLEAWHQQTKNPRSALILGIVAAEVGFKQCVGKLVPNAEWLVNHVPSPPLHKMLSEYLPLLPARQTIQGKVLKPPKRILTALNRGVKARNDTIHVGSKPPDSKELEELLLSVRDLLYLLDIYCGFEWAIKHIRYEVQEEMVQEFGLIRPKRPPTPAQ